MIYQPINVWPTTKAIDVLRDNTFSVEMNTSGSVIAYQLTILDWDNNIVLQEPRVELEEPLYNGDILYFNPVLKDILVNGNDYKWRLRLFQDTPTMVITSGFVTDVSGSTLTITRNTNIKTGMYVQIGNQTKTIQSITIDEDYYSVTVDSAFTGDIMGELFNILSSFIDTTPDFVLYARTTPSISITNFANEITDRHYIFRGSYSQAEYVPMTYYQIHLSIVQNNVSRLIYDTGKVYRADIKLDYDGYITGNTYQIELTVATESGVIVTTGIKTFTVRYSTVEFLTEPQLYLDCKRHAIRINWTTPISFDPTVYNVSTGINGTVSGVAGNTIQFEKGLDIKTGAIVIFDRKYENEVSIYNPESGLLAFRYSLEDEIKDGTPFIILNYAGNIGNLEIYLNDPYRMSNSANMLENVLTFRDSTNGYIGKTPENDNITFQFKLPPAFWDGALTKNMRLLPLIKLGTENDNIRGFEVFVNLNKLVFIKPATSGEKFYETTVSQVVNDTTLVLTNPIDFSTQKYMKFNNYDDIIEIINYDADTQTVILFEKPHFEVRAGNILTVYDTLSYNFYTLLAYFPLQEQGTWNGTYDYIWDDTKEWNDELYWFEGGGAKQRIANTWFKTRINGSEMDVRAGGV